MLGTMTQQTPERKRQREFDCLVHDKYKRIFSIVRAYLRNTADAEDATQETFLNAWRAWDTYDRRKPLDHWLARIAVNTSINRYRQRKNARTLSLDITMGEKGETLAEQLPDRLSDPLELVLMRESHLETVAAIQTLPPDMRTIIRLCGLEQHSYAEIARILKAPLGTVRSRIHRARTQLRRKLPR